MTFYEYRLRHWRGIPAADAIDYAKHDKWYHGGAFDPNTMTCRMREAEAEGDLVDVLNAEQEEKAWQRKKWKEAKRTEKDQGARQRANEIVRKTLAELTSREYSDSERRMVDNAMPRVFSMKPVSVSLDEAVGLRKRLRDHKPSKTKWNMVRFFEETYKGIIAVPGLGDVKLTKDSACSIYSHGGGGLIVTTVAALEGLKSLLWSGVIFSDNRNWKERGYDTIGLCTSMEFGGQAWITEFFIKRMRNGELELYTLKNITKKEVEDGARHDAAARATGENCTSSTRCIVYQKPAEESTGGGAAYYGNSEPPKIPSSNLVRQYLAAHGLLGRYVQGGSGGGSSEG